jgi:hypothetical protein
MGLKQFFCFLALCLPATFCHGQIKGFACPLDTTIFLSGTFGEFRGSHFHAGIDIRTFGMEGLPVKCAADGYVSRIKISPYGYGKAIYITHPNGYTSVYGHLSGFPKELHSYIRQHQYKRKAFSVELFPGKNQFRYKKGEIIAYSGNSGGSYAPHLHFEIRDTRTGEILNPLLFDIGVKDTVAPKLISAFFVEKNRAFKLKAGEYPEELRINFGEDSLITCYLKKGEKGLILAARDFINADTSNILGSYQVEICLDSQVVYDRKFSRFSFSDARYIQLISGYKEGLPPLEYCFKEAWNDQKLCNYYKSGWISLDFNDRKEYLLKIQISDEALNSSSKYILIRESGETENYPEEEMPSDKNGLRSCVFEEAYTFVVNERTLIDFASATFFDSVEVNVLYSEAGSGSKITIQPVHARTNEKFRISLPFPEEWKSEEKKACIYRENGEKLEYLGGTVHHGKIQTYSRSFGVFGLRIDNLAPEIRFLEIKDRKIYLEAKDDFSGIKNISGKINGSWFLLEYDPKTDLLTGDIESFSSGEKLEFSLTVSDHRENISHFKQIITVP